MKLIVNILIVILLLTVIFRMTCGIFVIQPIGAIPDGKTIVYWRVNTPNMPFIGSADGILKDKGMGVSLLGRGMVLATLVGQLKDKEIISFGYSEWLYLISTDGTKYEE
jgi:hypothetical protein